MDILKDLLKFLQERRKWWLVPVIVAFLFLGIVFLVTTSSAVAPFIYPFF